MDPTKDLDLGADDYTGESSDEELFGGFNSSKPYHDLYQHPMDFGRVDPTNQPVQDPVQYDPQQFEDFKMLEGELSALSSDAAGLGRVRREKESALDQFMTDTITPFYKDTLGMGMLDAEKSDFEDHDQLFKRFDDHFSVLDAQSKETGIFGGKNEEAIAGMTHFPRYQQIKQKYGRLKTDLDRFSNAEQNALNRKNALTQAKYSLPETFRRAADNYKAETGGAKISDKAFNELLDQQDFEEPIHGVNGLLNEDKLDPRIPYDGGYSATAGDLSEPVNKRNQAKLIAARKQGIKALQNTMALDKRDEGLRSQGINFSELGKFAGYPLYMNQGERAILNLEKAQKAGATTWKGVPIEQAFEELGGQDKLIASKMVETVFNAHNMVQDAAVQYWSDQTPEKKEKWELAKKVREEAWVQAAKMGLGNEIPGRGDTVGFWAGLGNAFKRGDLQEDLSDFSPALLGAIDVDTAQQIIDVMEATDELQTTSAYKAIKATKSDGFLEAVGKIFSNPSAIPEMVAETLTSFFSAWFTEGARVVPAFAAAGGAKGALFGSAAGPKGTLVGAGGGAVAGASLGVKASVPIASFVLEYAGEVLSELDKMGVDWRNPHIFVAAWNNPKIRSKIRAKAAQYAGGIAMIDAVAMGVVGRTHKAVSTKNIKSAVSVKAARDSAGVVTRKSNIAGMAAETAVQSGLGMSGEALGQIWSRDPGDPLIRDWDALAAEGIIEFTGPSGAAFVANAISSKAHTWQNDLGGVEETILLEHEGRKSVEGDAQTATVQQVDKGGWRFERKFFPNAQVARQELAATGVDFNTTSGRILGFLLDMLGGRIRNMGFVFSDRSPMSHNTKGAYDQLTGTVYVNENLSKDHAFTILHEASHFIEQMYGINVKKLYDELTPEEKENHWASYLQEGEAKFSSLSGWQRTMYNGVPFFRRFGEKDSARARSEWFAHQVVRVLTGMDQGVDPKIKQSVDDFLSKFESSEDARQFVGSSEGQNTRDLLASVLLQVMGVDQDGIYSDPDRWYNANFGTTEQQSNLAPSINLNQDFNSFTKYEKDVLAIFLGAYEGWDSLSRSNQNSIAKAFAGADLTNPNIQLEGTDALARLTNRQLQKQTKTQTVPGVEPSLAPRKGRGRRSSLLGSEGQVSPFEPTQINQPTTSGSEKSAKVTGAFSGRTEEEQGDPFSDYEQTLASIELDRQRTEEELDYLEQQADETAQEEAKLQREAERKEAEEAETSEKQADETAQEEAELELEAQREQAAKEVELERSYDETAQEEAELQREAERREAEEADRIEEEYDFLWEEYGIEPTRFTDIKDGKTLGSQSEKSDAVAFYTDLLSKARVTDKSKPFSATDPDRTLNQQEVYSSHFWRWNDSLVRKGVDDKARYKWFNKYHPDKFFEYYPAKTKQAPIGDAFVEYLVLRGPEKAPDKQQEFLLLGSGTEQKILDQAISLLGLTASDRVEAETSLIKSIKAYTDTLTDRDRKIAKRNPLIIMRGILGMNKENSIAPKSTSLVDEDKFILKRRLKDKFKKGIGFKNEHGKEGKKSLKDISGSGPVKSRYPRLSRSWGAFIPGEKGGVTFKDFANLSLEEREKAIIANRELYEKGRQGSDIPFTITEVDNAVEAYTESKQLAKLAAQAPNIKTVVPYGVHLVDSTKGEWVNLTAGGADLTRNIGKVGDYVNFRMANIVVNNTTKQEEALKNDPQNGQPIQKPDGVYAYEIMGYGYEYIDGVLVYQYDLRKVTKEEATKSLHWTEIPLSRIFDRSRGNEYYLSQEQREMWGDHQFSAKDPVTGEYGVRSQYLTIGQAMRSKKWQNMGLQLNMVEGKVAKNKLGKINKQGLALQTLAKLAGMEINRNGKIERFQQGPLFKFANITEQSASEIRDDAIDSTDARIALNMVFASINNTQDLTKSDLVKAQSVQKAQLMGKKDAFSNPINWENTQILNPNYEPVNMMAALFARVLDQLERMKIKDKRGKIIKPKIAARSLVDFQLLDLMGVAKWVEGIPDLEYFLHPEAKAVGTEALFTALKRRIVLAKQDPHTISTSSDGNVIKTLEEADPEWGKEFGGLEPSESLKNSEKAFLPSKYILKRKYFPAKSDPKGGKTYYPSGTKTTTERGKFEFYIDEVVDPNIDELGPVWELIDGQLTFVYEGRVVPKIERAVDGTTYVQLEEGSRRIKISKTHREEYDADELSIHAAFHKVNPDTIGVPDISGREYPPNLRVEASHSRWLREKKDTDYQEGKDPVQLVYVKPRKNETRTQAVNRAEKAGRGISVYRKKGDKHYGNPFSYFAGSKAEYNVGSKGNAIRLFALWLAAGDVRLYHALVYRGRLPESFASPESQKRVGVRFKVKGKNFDKALSSIDPLFEPIVTTEPSRDESGDKIFNVEVVLKSELSYQYAEREKALEKHEKSLRKAGAYYIVKRPVDTGKRKFLGVEEDTTGKPIISEEEGLPIDFSYKDKNGHWDQMLIADVEPKRRAWILKQIESGALDGKKLLYGIDTDAHRQDNHAEVLRELINSKRPQRDAEQWEIDWALGKDKEEGHYNYRYQIIKNATPKQVRMMGKMTGSPALTQYQQEQLEALLDDFNPTLFGESGKQNIHDKPIFNSEEDNPLSVANKTELGLISTGRPQSKNRMGKESLGGVADGLGQAIKWADYILLSYLISHPNVSNPEAELAKLNARFGSQWSSLTGTNYFKGKDSYGKSSKRKSYYADGDIGRKRAEFIYNEKLLLIRKLVANSVGLTERFGESIETPVAEDTSVESIKDSENLGSMLTTDDDSADTSAKGRDQAKEVRSELIDTKDESSLTPAELMEIEEGNTGVDESPEGAAARLKREEAAQAYEEAIFKNVFVIDDDVISKLADQSPMFAEQDKLAKAEKLSKENEKKVNTFVDKALEKSVRQGWDAEAVQRISAQLLKTKLYDNIELAQDKVRERAGKFIESAKNDPKKLRKDRLNKLKLQREKGEASWEDPGAPQEPDNKNPWKKNPKTGKWEQRKPSRQSDVTPAQQGWIQKTENLEEQFENLLRGVRDQGIAKKLERLDNLPEEQKKQFQFAFEAMMKDLADKGMLGSSFLTSELQNTFFEKLKWMVMGMSQGGYDKLPESVQSLVYGFRLKIFSQFISYEDLHMRIIHALRLQDGSKAKDFFDLQGHIIRNFATVKAASDYWRTALRDPILEYLKEYGVTPEEWGAYSIAIGTSLKNRYLERKHKRALEKQESALYGPLIWDEENKQQVRDTKLGAEDKLRKQKEAVEKLKSDPKANKKRVEQETARLSKMESNVATLKKKIKALDLSAYFIDGEFAGAGMTSQEALDTYKSIKSEERFKKLLAETDIQQKFAQLNLQTIAILATSGLLDAGQAFRMYISHYRPPEATNEREAYNIALKNLQDLGIDFENTDIPVTWEDLGKDEDGIKLKQWWKKHYEKSQIEISQGLPKGYWYSPMTGFKDVEGFYQTQDEINSIMGTGPKSGGKGAGRGVEPSRTNRLFQFSKGRKAGTAPPDPKAVLGYSFAAAENAVIRVAKKPSSEHVINLYSLYEVLHKHQDNFEGLVGKYKDHQEDMFGGVLPESQGNLIEAWDLGPIFENKHALKDLFEELDKVFEPMEYDTEKGHPIEEEVVFEEQEVDGVKRLELVHRIRRVDDNDTSLFIDRRNGQRVYAKFKQNVQGTRFNAELKNIGYQPLHWLLHNNYFSINTLTRLMAMSFTSWNPDFVLTNQVRDAINARLNMSESKNKEFYREFKKGYIKKLIKANAGILKAETKIESWRKWNKMSSVQKRKKIQELGIPDDLEGMKKKYKLDNLDSEGWQAWWLWLEQKGLRTSFIRLDSASDIMRQIDADFKGLTAATAWTKLKGSRGVQFVKNFGENVVDPLNTMIENSTRVVVAVEALKAGMTEHQAIKLGRNVSVDFNRKGTMSSGIGALVVFFNAGVQGNLRFARSLIMRGPKDAARIVASIAGFSFLWAWLQMLLSGEEDEENFSHYDQLSDVKKNTNLVGFIPGTKTHFSLPLPYGWNWIWAFGQIAAQRSARAVDYGGQGVGTMEGIGNLTENFHRQFSPIGGAPDVAGVPIPTFMAPFVEISKNENFFGAPIEKVKFPFDPPKPAAYMSRKGTAAFWKDFSILVNSASGGDEVTPGSLKRLFGDNSLYNSPENDVEWAISGSAMEHVYNSFTGGFGATFSRVISGGVSAMKGDFEPNFDEIPVVRRFVRTDYSNYKTLERFFNLRDRANMADRYVKMAKKGAMPPKEAREMMRLNRNLINIKGLIDAADTSRKALKRKADAIEQSNMPASEKRDKLEEIEKQTMANYRKVLIKATKLNIEV